MRFSRPYFFCLFNFFLFIRPVIYARPDDGTLLTVAKKYCRQSHTELNKNRVHAASPEGVKPQWRFGKMHPLHTCLALSLYIHASTTFAARKFIAELKKNIYIYIIIIIYSYNTFYIAADIIFSDRFLYLLKCMYRWYSLSLYIYIYRILYYCRIICRPCVGC